MERLTYKYHSRAAFWVCVESGTLFHFKILRINKQLGCSECDDFQIHKLNSCKIQDKTCFLALKQSVSIHYVLILSKSETKTGNTLSRLEDVWTFPDTINC